MIDLFDACACCTLPATCAVWGHKLCRRCSDRWYKEAPEPGSDFDDVGRAYREFTQVWIERKRAAK